MAQKGALKGAIAWDKDIDTKFLRAISPDLVASSRLK
jgi:hypothetical protein